MYKLYFDIETLPAHEDVHGVLLEIHKKRVEDGKKIVEFEEFIASTTFDGGWGRICCISYAIDDKAVKTLSGTEKEMLEEFWNIAKDASLFIGFNILDFDLRFIYQRSIVLGVKPSRDISFARYRSSPIYDIMKEWVKWGSGNISLDMLAHILNLETSKGGAVEGKNVHQAFKDGRLPEICEYCEKDVELTRKIYKKMNFEEKKPLQDNTIPF